MGVFLSDRLDFTGPLVGHAANVGGTWAADTSLNSNAPGNGNGTAVAWGVDYALAKSPATPGTANQVAEMIFAQAGGGSGICSVHVRWTTAGTGYMCSHEEGFGGNNLILRKYVAGSIQGISTLVGGVNVGTTAHTMRLETTDISGGVRVTLFLDGTQRLTFDDTTSPITAAGYVAIGGRSSFTNDLIVTDSAAAGTAPTIGTHPASQTVTAGATATFTAAATGTPTPTWQWQRSTNSGSTWADISGATSASYTTPATTVTGGTANNGDQFRAVATNTAGTAPSTAATLTVNAPVVTPGTPSALATMDVGPVTALVTLGASTNATSYEARINDGLGGALAVSYTAFATVASSWAGTVVGRAYKIEWRGINAGTPGPVQTGTFMVQLGAVTPTGSGGFIAALTALLNA